MKRLTIAALMLGLCIGLACGDDESDVPTGPAEPPPNEGTTRTFPITVECQNEHYKATWANAHRMCIEYGYEIAKSYKQTGYCHVGSADIWGPWIIEVTCWKP